MSATKKLIILTTFLGAILVYSLFLPDEGDSSKSKIETKVSLGQICFPEYNPSEGKLLFDEIQYRHKDCDLSLMLSSLGEDNRLLIFIPIDEYNKLSLEDKKKIMNYASSLIPDAKKHPYHYSMIPSTAPIFKMKPNLMEESTRMMSYRSCAIAVGPIEEGNYYKTGGESVYGCFVAEEQFVRPNDLEANMALPDVSSTINKNIDTPLMKAIINNASLSEIKALLEADADIEAKDVSGATPLMLAANFNKNPEVFKELLDSGADIEAKLGNSGVTVLMMAVLVNDNPEILELLLDYGADIEAKDNKGRTVSYYKKAGIEMREKLREIATPSHSVGIVQNSPWDDSVPQVKSYIKRNLKDPKSFNAIVWGNVTKISGGNFQVSCEYRAKNSLGGYVISHQLFTLNSRGAVINVQEL